MAFKDLQDSLGTSIDNLMAKKAAMDKAKAALDQASMEYSKAYDAAKLARDKVDEALGVVGLHSDSGRVRVSG